MYPYLWWQIMVILMNMCPSLFRPEVMLTHWWPVMHMHTWLIVGLAMRDSVTLYQCLSLAGCKPRISPVHITMNLVIIGSGKGLYVCSCNLLPEPILVIIELISQKKSSKDVDIWFRSQHIEENKVPGLLWFEYVDINHEPSWLKFPSLLCTYMTGWLGIMWTNHLFISYPAMKYSRCTVKPQDLWFVRKPHLLAWQLWLLSTKMLIT